MMGENDDRWYFPKDKLNDSPSRRHGYDADKELSCRQQAANFIQDMGQKLQVSQLCINTAIVYMHRFYVFHSLQQFHRNAIATAALFLAAKVEEQPRKVEHVLKVAHLCLHRETPVSLDTKSELYIEQANDLVVNESILLQTLGFDVAIDHPHTHVVRCCQLVKASKDLAQTSYFMASNSLHLTTMCLQYKPTVVACFCIHLACKWSNWEIPRSSEGKDWFWYVNQSVTLDLLEQLTSEFLLIFDKCPTKLKRKMMSINQTNPPVNLGQPSTTQESYHFDEPRKLMGAEANRPPLSFLQMQKSSENYSSSSQNRTAATANQQPPQLAPKTRYIDYKEYKEKKERERQERERVERVQRDNNHTTLAATTATTTTTGTATTAAAAAAPHSTKSNDKTKQQASQRSQANVTSQKVYSAPKAHANNSSKESHGHSQKVPSKEALKRKFDEMETPGQEQLNHHKLFNQGQESQANKTNAPAAPAQSLKAHRADERTYQNYQYPRSGEKHSSSRSTQPTPKPSEAPKVEEVSNPDWHGKPADRYNVKTAAAVPPTQQFPLKPKENKTKGAHAFNSAQGQTPSSSSSSSSSSSHVHNKKGGEKVNKKYPTLPAERSLPASMDSLLMVEDQNQRTKSEMKRPHPNDVAKKSVTVNNKYNQQKIKPNPQSRQVYKEPGFDNPPGELELPQLMEKMERPPKMARIEEKKKFEPEPIKPLMSLLEDQLIKSSKSISIFSPESNVSPKNIISSLDKDVRKTEVPNTQYQSTHQKKIISSLFSPPSLNTCRSNEVVFPPQPALVKHEHALPSLDDRPIQRQTKLENLLAAPAVVPTPVSVINHSVRHGPEPGAIIYPPQEKPKIQSAFPAPIVEKPMDSPVSTVNLLGMEKMLDTSISPSTAAVIKPMASMRPEMAPPKPLMNPVVKIEEKMRIDENEYYKKSEKKKNKDKDKDRHKDKKKSDGKKEKKKHKDKDKERRKDGHKDKSKDWDRPPVTHSSENNLKLTIPKERLNVGEGSGLKIKIAKDRLKPEEPMANEGGLKIKIKKDVIANFKEDKSKKRDNASAGSHHKVHRNESVTVLKVVKRGDNLDRKGNVPE